MIEKLYILYASQTGTAEDLAFEINDIAKSKNIVTDLKELDDILLEKFKEIKRVMVITSTTGEGDIPYNGELFFEKLFGTADINLSQMRYGVIALGDSSHYEFCKAGRDIDERLKYLGAVCILDRLECDYDTKGSIEWASKFFNLLNNH